MTVSVGQKEATVHRAIPIVILSLLLAAASSPSHAGEPGDPKQLVDGFVRAWNAHDMKALADLFTEDADFVNLTGVRWRGRAQIQAMHERSHAGRFKATTIVETNTDVRMLGPDVAVMHFRWEVSGTRDAEGRRGRILHGIMHIVAVRQGDGWRIVSAQNTNAMPPV